MSGAHLQEISSDDDDDANAVGAGEGAELARLSGEAAVGKAAAGEAATGDAAAGDGAGFVGEGLAAEAAMNAGIHAGIAEIAAQMVGGVEVEGIGVMQQDAPDLQQVPGGEDRAFGLGTVTEAMAVDAVGSPEVEIDELREEDWEEALSLNMAV